MYFIDTLRAEAAEILLTELDQVYYLNLISLRPSNTVYLVILSQA